MVVANSSTVEANSFDFVLRERISIISSRCVVSVAVHSSFISGEENKTTTVMKHVEIHAGPKWSSVRADEGRFGDVQAERLLQVLGHVEQELETVHDDR